MSSFDLLINKFDKIYVLTLSHRHDRQAAIMRQLVSVGYDSDNIEHLRKLNIVYTTKWKYNHIICNAINKYYRRQCFTKANEYDCTRNHYNIIKSAYDLNYNNILIIEDDMRFLKLEIFNDFINHFPEDYSMVQCAGFSAQKVFQQVNETYKKGLYFIKDMPVNLWTTGMYALSKKGMVHYINFIDNQISVADIPLYQHPKEDYYFSSIPMAIQADKDICSSDIRNNQNDHIDYNTQNMYESIDKDMYMAYD